ncbi:hypothetical protein IEQ34_001782 [Dendrobium chrysotoxum]|uniref:Gnk2-homologous domain-containing protein n=1 Tax=Dendrobium chrysotoxum TaxID=161865 RepID=A0AAV7FL81_DENCH|nr:hypothetical protein IEQ34_026767 [Dendrobium chrysotoxum]KAH0470224.1 hypothetical protein IEQ34_001782 [Dendrobium chrysotoxum]
MLLLPSLSFYLVIFVPFVAAQYFAEDIPYFIYCSDENFTSPGLYETNVHVLLRGLAKWSDGGSLYRTEVSGNSPTFEVFGLAQCRPHISIDVCNECLNHSASVIITDSSGNCGRRRSTIVRFDLCVLRYSDFRFYGIPEQKPFRFIPTKSLIGTTDGIHDVARDELPYVLSKAAMDDSRFAERITKDSVGQLIIATAWCTMDLSSSDCLQCLRTAEESFPDRKSWGIVTSLSCEVRLFTYPVSFDNSWPPSPLSPLLASNPTVPIPQPWPSKEGKMSKTAEMILLVGAFGVFTSVALFLISFFLLQKRRNKK